MNNEPSLYEIVGRRGFEDLVAAFYRQVPSDKVLGPLYPMDELDAAERRLREFLVFRFGGDSTYIEERGHPRLRMRHMGFPIDATARDRWLELMRAAMVEVGFSSEIRAELSAFFEQAANHMINKETDEGS